VRILFFFSPFSFSPLEPSSSSLKLISLSHVFLSHPSPLTHPTPSLLQTLVRIPSAALSRSLAADRHNLKPLGSTHRALDDINASIRELRQYRANVFIPPPAPTEEEKEEVKRFVEGATRL